MGIGDGCVEERQSQVESELNKVRDVADSLDHIVDRFENKLAGILVSSSPQPVDPGIGGEAAKSTSRVPLAAELSSMTRRCFSSLSDLESIMDRLEL